MLLVVFNLFYNNLVINLRFKCKIYCVTIGMCVFDAMNILCCYCFLLTPCRDQCFKPWTLIKWAVKFIIFGYTIALVKIKCSEWEDQFELGTVPMHENPFDTYLIIYCLQHLIFITMRIPLFFLYTMLTFCCDKGNEYN